MPTRRSLFESALACGGLWLFGCEDERARGPNGCSTFRGGQRLENVPFSGEGDVTFGTIDGQGWDGRLYTDLSELHPDALVIPNDRFYVRTLYPDLLDPAAPWQISVDGMVETPQALTLADLAPFRRNQGVHLLECSGNTAGGSFGLMSAADWAGASLVELLETLPVLPEATRVLVSGFDQHSVPSQNGHSTPGASWIFRFEDLERAGAFLATEMNGAALPPHHGAPVRLFVPNWYGCACIKWVDRITLVDDSASATSQMKEFASRTHQNGVPELARDYTPATLDQAAMPIRVEKWKLEGRVVYRVVGILWGGYAVTDALEIRFGQSAWQRVDVCPAHTGNDPWTLWEHRFEPSAPGSYAIALRVNDPAVPQRRLDLGWYTRTIDVDEI